MSFDDLQIKDGDLPIIYVMSCFFLEPPVKVELLFVSRHAESGDRGIALYRRAAPSQEGLFDLQLGLLSNGFALLKEVRTGAL